MNWTGIIIGAAVFLSIGICHPITIKLEYYFGRKGWWGFNSFRAFVGSKR